MTHKNGSARRAEINQGNQRLLRRYESEVAACEAELRKAKRRGRRGRIDRLHARLAVFEDECAAIAEYLAGYNGTDARMDEKA